MTDEKYEQYDGSGYTASINKPIRKIILGVTPIVLTLDCCDRNGDPVCSIYLTHAEARKIGQKILDVTTTE